MNAKHRAELQTLFEKIVQKFETTGKICDESQKKVIRILNRLPRSKGRDQQIDNFNYVLKTLRSVGDDSDDDDPLCDKSDRSENSSNQCIQQAFEDFRSYMSTTEEAIKPSS